MGFLRNLRNYYFWPSWHGSLIRWSKSKTPTFLAWNKPHLNLFSKCSHDTARQFRIDWWRWSWFIVLRHRTRDVMSKK